MAPKKTVEPNELMIVNDSPGEECRIAILADNHLEELFTERRATATNVGNIYKGRVINVEPAIQAAFIDYGEGANGFLHISDLHPKYFPGEERTERVGKKIPRRERPPIQAALRRGDEILVQVLKEGIGTKGPTLTSYLSIPGRLLVMMPSMDRVGVSRKVEDEEKRRKMREILDSLDLPEGFGFIVRTAGFDGKTKTELKRDAAYLMRLWKVMEKRIKGVKAPCELYTESDLLIRTVRDVLRPSIKAIIVDSESGYERMSMFLRVVSPRSAPKVIRYRRRAPIFHAFDVERQIELIHAREVPLPSGGRLVIDQTEALVAIDVNSGRSRSARDSETNAYETNVEATDEICRQIRLRDLGGLIVNDLIDMRSSKHRKQIEERFNQNLKRDRAKATALAISDFGILEMTRQRMRPSLRKSHFMDCPHCSGHGEIKVPEYVAADAARHIGFLLQYERVHRVEVVCSPRVASVMLSGKRRELVRLEDLTGKRIDVRVSDAITVDRVDYYAYDQRNADIDIFKLPPLTPPSLVELESEQATVADTVTHQPIDQAAAKLGRAPQAGPADAGSIAWDDEFEESLDDADETLSAAGAATPSGDAQDSGGGRRGRRRRRRRGGGGGGGGSGAAAGGGQAPHHHADHVRQPGSTPAQPLEPAIDGLTAADMDAWASPEPAQSPPESNGAASPAAPVHSSEQGGKRGRRRRGRRGRRRGHEQPHGQPAAHSQSPETDRQSPVTESPASPESGSSDASIRIHELARELKVSSREVIDRCEPDPAIHPLTNSLSSVSSGEAQTIRAMFSNGETVTEVAASPAPGVSAMHVSVDQIEQPGGSPGSSRRRRRRRRGGNNGKGGPLAPHTTATHSAAMPIANDHDAAQTISPVQAEASTSTLIAAGEQNQGRRSRRRRRGRKGAGQNQSHAASEASGGNSTGGTMPNQGSTGAGSPRPSSQSQATTDQPSGAGAPQSSSPPKKPRRALYRAGRAPVSQAARERAATQDE